VHDAAGLQAAAADGHVQRVDDQGGAMVVSH
jgi:hypothetical protein